MKCLFVYNPVSGRGKTAKRLKKIVRALRERYGDVCVCASKQRGDMTRIIREQAHLFDAVVFSGGDAIPSASPSGWAGRSRSSAPAAPPPSTA